MFGQKLPQFGIATSYLKDRSVRLNLFFSLLVLLGLWGIVLSSARGVEGLVAWHYTIYFGIDRIGPWFMRLLLPVIASACFVLNFLSAAVFFDRQRLLSYLLVWLTSIVLLLMLAAGFLINLFS